MGAMALQGPHHTAQKSTSTGCFDCNTSCSNVLSVTSNGFAMMDCLLSETRDEPAVSCPYAPTIAILYQFGSAIARPASSRDVAGSPKAKARAIGELATAADYARTMRASTANAPAG